jgi:hypothetical protein
MNKNRVAPEFSDIQSMSANIITSISPLAKRGANCDLSVRNYKRLTGLPAGTIATMTAPVNHKNT